MRPGFFHVHPPVVSQARSQRDDARRAAFGTTPSGTNACPKIDVHLCRSGAVMSSPNQRLEYDGQRRAPPQTNQSTSWLRERASRRRSALPDTASEPTRRHARDYSCRGLANRPPAQSHPMNQCHIAAARHITFTTLRAGVSSNRVIPTGPYNCRRVRKRPIIRAFRPQSRQLAGQPSPRTMIHLMKTA